VRLGGGPTITRDFLAAGLVDELEGIEKDYEVEATSSPSGVTHMTFTRAGS
jgi:hypothetical protein